MSAGESIAGQIARDVIRRVRGLVDWIPELDNTGKVPVAQLGDAEESLLSDAQLVLNRARHWVVPPVTPPVVDELFNEVIG